MTREQLIEAAVRDVLGEDGIAFAKTNGYVTLTAVELIVFRSLVVRCYFDMLAGIIPVKQSPPRASVQSA